MTRPLVIGAEADRVEDLWKRMWWHAHYGGRGVELDWAGLEMLRAG